LRRDGRREKEALTKGWSFVINLHMTKEQKREYNRKYHAANAEKLRARALEWYRANRGSIDKDHRKKYMKEYALANRDKFRRTPEQQKRYNEKRKKEYAENPAIRAAAKEQVKAWQEKNPLKRKAQRLRKYGITIEQMEATMKKQGGACAICGEKDASRGLHFPVIDHCHGTGKFRGILCGKCNKGIGLLMDSPKLLKAAARYLERNG
jgi:hypothetical protein